MYTGSFLNVLVTSYLFILSGAQKISTCPDGHVNVGENKYIILRCEDFDHTYTVIWKIGKSVSVLTDLATCRPTLSCSLLTDGVTGADRITDNGKEYSVLYLNVTRSQHTYVVVCAKESSTRKSQSQPPCMLNVTEASSQPSTGTTKGPTTGTAIHSPQDKNPTDAPVGAIVGGAVAAFVVVIVIVLVVIIVRRKRRREHSGKDASHEHQVHYSPENGTGVDVVTSQNADGDTSAGPPEFGIYAFPGGDEPATIPDNTPAAEEDDVGMYAAPKADVYAAVDKSKQKKNKPANSDHPDASQAAAVGDEYAVVNKASKKTDASNSTGLSEVHIPEDNDAAPAPYIYAQVDKAARNAKTAVSVPSTPEEEGATYAQVQKPKKK